MKILHFSPKLRPGSPMALAVDLACALQNDGYENVVVSPQSELISRLNIVGVRHLSCRRSGILNLWKNIRRLKSLIRSNKPDFVQVYSAEAAWIVGMACKGLDKTSKPTIVGAITGYPRKGLAIKGWRHCDIFTAISKHLRNHVTAEDFPLKCNPWVIPYGVDDKQCYPAYAPSPTWLEQWQRNHPEAKDKFTICVPGAISPLHGLEELVPILTGLLRSDITPHVYIAGDTRKANSAYLENLKKTFKEAQLSGYITWLGLRSDLRDVLCVCDVSLSLTKEPATWDRAILEALSLGRPVVGYDHGVIGELLETFLPEGCVAPGDSAAVIDTLTQWNTYSPSPGQEVPFPYRITDTAETYKNLYKEMLGK